MARQLNQRGGGQRAFLLFLYCFTKDFLQFTRVGIRSEMKKILERKKEVLEGKKKRSFGKGNKSFGNVKKALKNYLGKL